MAQQRAGEPHGDGEVGSGRTGEAVRDRQHVHQTGDRVQAVDVVGEIIERLPGAADGDGADPRQPGRVQTAGGCAAVGAGHAGRADR